MTKDKLRDALREAMAEWQAALNAHEDGKVETIEPARVKFVRRFRYDSIRSQKAAAVLRDPRQLRVYRFLLFLGSHATALNTRAASVRVVVTNNKTVVSTVCYVRDPDVARDEQGYCSTVSLIGQDERARAALVNEFSRAASALRRARELAIAFGMAGEIDAVVESVETMRTRVEARVEQQAAA